ncbi:hypothetical protein U0070_022847 [Myodes glareolus]|uniref:Uncharacterized protein n=1 Tax=Myodes glareolus TaxID=447135 RepID=A0AAW0KAI4_MYOGA
MPRFTCVSRDSRQAKEILLGGVFFVYSTRETALITRNGIKSWVDKMQEDLVTLAKTASGVTQLADIYEKYQEMYTVEPNNARQLVEIAARDIEKLLSNRSKALVVSSACALSLGHSC